MMTRVLISFWLIGAGVAGAEEFAQEKTDKPIAIERRLSSPLLDNQTILQSSDASLSLETKTRPAQGDPLRNPNQIWEQRYHVVYQQKLTDDLDFRLTPELGTKSQTTFLDEDVTTRSQDNIASGTSWELGWRPWDNGQMRTVSQFTKTENLSDRTIHNYSSNGLELSQKLGQTTAGLSWRRESDSIADQPVYDSSRNTYQLSLQRPLPVLPLQWRMAAGVEEITTGTAGQSPGRWYTPTLDNSLGWKPQTGTELNFGLRGRQSRDLLAERTDKTQAFYTQWHQTLTEQAQFKAQADFARNWNESTDDDSNFAARSVNLAMGPSWRLNETLSADFQMNYRIDESEQRRWQATEQHIMFTLQGNF